MRRVKARLLLLFSAPGRITNWPERSRIHSKASPRITSAASARNEWLAQIYPLWVGGRRGQGKAGLAVGRAAFPSCGREVKTPP